MDRIGVGFGGAPPWAVSAPDLDVGAWAWVQIKVNRPALSHRTGVRSSRQDRKRLWAGVFIFLCACPNVRSV